MPVVRTTRFAGADWAEELKEITLIGVGGIGSWTALNLSRIGHDLVIYDGDIVDETNVHGGQMYTISSVGMKKADAVRKMCAEMGCVSKIEVISNMYQRKSGLTPITITGLDNMAARELVYLDWKLEFENDPDALLIDGRLLMENMEIITIQGGNREQMERYEKEFLFSDAEVEELDCTTKQSTFSAMIISGLITATLCNFLTNKKLGFEMREIPFHQRLFLPIFNHETVNLEIKSVSIQEAEIPTEMAI